MHSGRGSTSDRKFPSSIPVQAKDRHPGGNAYADKELVEALPWLSEPIIEINSSSKDKKQDIAAIISYIYL